MKIDSKKLTKNIFSLSFGQLLSLVLNFLAIAFAAKYYGPDDFGVFSNVLAIIGILSKLVDLGFGPIVFRELSKSDSDFELLDKSVSIRLVLLLGLILVFNVIGILLQLSTLEIILGNIIIPTVLISAKAVNIRELLSIPFKVKIKMHYPMIFLTLDNFVLLLGVYLVITFNLSLEIFTLFYTITNLPGFILLLYFLYKKFHYKFSFNVRSWKWLVQESLPIGGLVILITIFQQMDIILLSYLNSSYDAGIYSVALRISMPLSIIPASIVTTVFPYIVKKQQVNLDSDYINTFVFKLLFWFAYVIFIVFYFKAESYLGFVFGKEYLDSAFSSSLLLIVQVFLFFNFFAIDLLTVHNKQSWNFIYSTIIVLVNVVLAFILIPSLNFNGAAIAKVIASFAGFIFLSAILLKNNIKFNFVSIRLVIWVLLIPITAYIFSGLHWTLYSFLLPIGILLITFGLSIFSKNEINLIISSLGLNKKKFIK